MSYPPPPGQGENENADQPPYGSVPPPPPPYGAPPPPYGGAPGYPAPYGNPYGPPQQGNQKALWALILGIFGLLCCGIASIVALVLGHQAKQEIAASNGTQTGDGQAQAGFILGIIGCVLWVVGIIVYVIILAAADSYTY